MYANTAWPLHVLRTAECTGESLCFVDVSRCFWLFSFQILSHCGSENIFRSLLVYGDTLGKQHCLFLLLEGKKRWLSFNMHKVMGRSDLLPVFAQQLSCSSKDLTRSSLVVLKPVKQGWVTPAGDLTTVYTLKNNPNKQHRLCLSPGVLFQIFQIFQIYLTGCPTWTTCYVDRTKKRAWRVLKNLKEERVKSPASDRHPW